MASIGLIGTSLYRPFAGTSSTMVLQGALIILLAGIATLIGARLVLALAIRTAETG